MKGINKVILIGSLGKEPEVRALGNGESVASFSLATSEKWRDKNTGETKEKTEWHKVVIFGKLANVAGQYLTKGSQVYIEGKLQTRKWTDQGGQDRHTTEVVVQGFSGVMQMLGSPNNQGRKQQYQPRQPQQPQQQYNYQNQQHQAQANNYQQVPNANDFNDDVPF